MKKKTKKIKRLIVEELPRAIAESDILTEINPQLVDIAEDAIEDERKRAKTERERSIISFHELDDWKRLIRLRTGPPISNKSSRKSTEWVFYDYINGFWYVFDTIRGRNEYSKPVKVADNEAIHIKHLEDEKFTLTSSLGSMVYNASKNSIEAYTIAGED